MNPKTYIHNSYTQFYNSVSKQKKRQCQYCLPSETFKLYFCSNYYVVAVTNGDDDDDDDGDGSADANIKSEKFSLKIFS